MSSLKEISFSILNTVRPLSSSGGIIPLELINYHVKNTRSLLARQHIGKYGTLPDTYFQPLGCVNLVQLDQSECCDFPTSCLILRSEVQIPNTIDGRLDLLQVGPVNITLPRFSAIEYNAVPFFGLNKYTKNIIKYFIGPSGYLYLLAQEGDLLLNSLEVINIFGALEDPEEASSFHSCNTGGVCFSSESKYPMPDSITPILQEMIIKKFMYPSSIAPIDGTNDNKVNPESTITK